MVYEADTLRDVLFTNWALTDRLQKNEPGAGNRPVFFFAHEQVSDKLETKSINVIKDTSIKTRRKTEFFSIEEDRFTLEVRYKLQGTNADDWDTSEADAEDMEEEVNRIIDTVFNPHLGTGIFFSSDFVWDNQDRISDDVASPMILRILTITLTRIVSRTTNVFDSFQRGIIFDDSASQGDNKPGADYSYTEVFNVEAFEGFSDKSLQVQAHPDGVGVPLLYSGAFGGTIIMSSYFKDTDVGTTTDKINQIYKRQSNGEHPEVVLVRTYTNAAGQTLTKTSTVRILEIKDPEPTSNILEWQMIGKIIKPSTWSVV